MPDVDDALAAAIGWARSEPGVVGMLRIGSSARDGLSTSASDVDVMVVTSGASAPPPGWPGVDIGAATIEGLLTPVLQYDDYVGWYLRSTCTCVEVLVDRTDGELAMAIERQATLTEAEARVVVAQQLDGFLNLALRSAKQWTAGRSDGARLDAVESLSWAITTVFALERRVRPYNGYLRWELERHPLTTPAFDTETLLALVGAVASGGGVAELRALARPLLTEGRAAGFGEVIDSWGDALLPLEPTAGVEA